MTGQPAGTYLVSVIAHSTVSATYVTRQFTVYVDTPTATVTIDRPGTGTGAVTASGLTCPGGAIQYPERTPAEVLDDLVAATPGDAGKWFAAAKDAKLFDKAIALANLTPCSPQTLTRAARDFAETNPTFALEAGVTAIRWLAQGHGYDVTALDVHDAYTHTMVAATHAGRADEIRGLIRQYLSDGPLREFMMKVMGRQPDLP